MFVSFFRKVFLTFFFFAFFSFFPGVCFGFEVSPSVTDLSFSQTAEGVTQSISVINTNDVQKTYTAEMQMVTFASDGSISNLSPVLAAIDARVSPQGSVLLPGMEQVFTVAFSHPEFVTADEVFALVVREQGGSSDQLSSSFAAFIFPTDISSDDVATFRIDGFSVVHASGGLQAIAQFTNTGDVLAHPSSIIVARDFLGREIGRSIFAEHGGRLPVGTTRGISEALPYEDFGVWHLGGAVTFTLLSVDAGGGAVQRAVITVQTFPGKGVIAILVSFALLFIAGAIFFFKKRGILRS